MAHLDLIIRKQYCHVVVKEIIMRLVFGDVLFSILAILYS